MDTVLIRDLVGSSGKPTKLSTAICLVLSASLVLWLIIIVITYAFSDREFFIVVCLATCGVLFQFWVVFDCHFQSIVLSKKSATAKSAAMLLGAVFKMFLVYVDANLYWITFAFSVDQLLMMLFLYLAFRKTNINISLMTGMTGVKELAYSAFPYMLSSLLTILFLRLDQLVVQYYLGSFSLGVYAAAIKIYEGWNIFLFVIITSIFPLLIKLKKTDEKRYLAFLKKMLWGVVSLHYCMAYSVFRFNDEIILYTFGESYAESAVLLPYLVFASIFMTFNYINQKTFALVGYGKSLLLRSVVAVSLIAFLSIYLVPLNGLEGALQSILVSVVVSFYLLDLLSKSTRGNFWMKTKALLLIWK